MSKPVIHYFPLRGRAEVMRIALSYKGVDYEEHSVDYANMKSDTELYPFGQCPRYVDGDMDLVQSNTIIRFIGRKYGLMGSTEAQHCIIDMVLEGIESLRVKYVTLIYQDELSDSAKKAYWETHLNKGSISGRNNGAHMLFLSKLLAKSGSGYIAGTAEPSMGDLALFEIVDLHTRIFPEQMKAEYPDMVELYDRVAALPSIKAYLDSPKRLAKVNNNNLG